MDYTKKILTWEYGISEAVYEKVKEAESKVVGEFDKIDEITEYNQLKVISAMQKNRLAIDHFGGTTGYGYDDGGRDVMEKIYATPILSAFFIFPPCPQTASVYMLSGHLLKNFRTMS